MYIEGNDNIYVDFSTARISHQGSGCACYCVFFIFLAQGSLRIGEKKYIFFQVAALLNLFPTQREWEKVGYGSFPLSSKTKEAVSVLRGMICSSSSLGISAPEMEKYIQSVSLKPAITED